MVVFSLFSVWFCGACFQLALEPQEFPLDGLADSGSFSKAEPSPESAFELWKASYSGNTSMMVIALDYMNADPDAANDQGWTALMWLALRGHESCMKKFLEYEPELNLREKMNGETALHMAARSGHHGIVSLLLDKGADPTIVDEQAFHSLHVAARQQDRKLLKTLLAGARKVPDFKLDPTLLHIAATNNDDKTLTFLLDRSSLIDGRSSHFEKQTALMGASRTGSLRTTTLLLERGASLTLSDRRGRTVMAHAINGGNPELVSLLIKKGYRVNNAEGQNCLKLAEHILFDQPSSMEIAAILRRHGAPEWRKNRLGQNL